MTQVLLVGTDCSECSERTLNFAAQWAKRDGFTMIIVHVIEWSPFSFNTAQENAERHMRREEELARAHTEIVDPIVQRLRDEGIEAKGVIRHGHPAETLSSVAKELNATHIIIGRTGRSAIKSKLFGSAASTLVQIADRPVTVVP